MFFNNFSKREKYLALITISVVVIAAAYVFLIMPLRVGWKSVANQIQAKLATLEKDAGILSSQSTVASEYEKLAKNARPGKSDEEAMSDTLAYVENISKNDSCIIADIKPNGVTDSGAYKEILINISAEATIEQFSKFLYDIENPRDNLMNIKSFDLSVKSGQTGTLKGTFVISKIILK